MAQPARVTTTARPASAPRRREAPSRTHPLPAENAPVHELIAPLWERARADGRAVLPHAELLRERIDADLDAVEVRSGPHVTSLLDFLGAEAAATGGVVLLRPGERSLDTIAHEVIHALQADPGASAPAAVLDASHAAESDADHLAAQVAGGLHSGPLTVPRHGAVGGRLALRRSSPQQVAARNQEAHSTAEAPTRERSDEVAPPQVAPVTPEQTAEPEQTEDRAKRRARRAGGGGPDRTRLVRAQARQAQEDFDTGRGRASAHRVDVCDRQRPQPGQQPFARGPPIAAPATQPEPTEGAVEPAAPPPDTIFAQEAALFAQVGRGPTPTATAPAAEGSQEAEVRALAREADEPARTQVTDPADPVVGEQPGTVTTEIDAANVATAATAERSADALRRGEDLGEGRMAPARDPADGLDRNLDGLQLPKVGVAERYSEERLAEVATEANADTVPLDRARVIDDRTAQRLEQDVAAQRRHQAAVDGELKASDRQVATRCREACQARDRQRELARRGTSARRERWEQETDVHITRRRSDAEALQRERRRHVTDVRTRSETDARTRLQGARRKATDALQDGRSRARTKANDARSGSWWSRGIAWFREQLSGLRRWVHDFLEKVRTAAQRLLDAARTAAHALIEAGRKAITATIKATQRTLSAIADNLPGDVGVIARRWRDDANDFLDGVQEQVDRTATAFHDAVDRTINNLKGRLDRTLADFQQGVDNAFAAVDEVLSGEALLALLRRHLPGLAELVDLGVDGLIDRAGTKLADAVQGLMDGTGVTSIVEVLEGLHEDSACGGGGEEGEDSAGCEAFKSLVMSAYKWFDKLLQSPAAQAVQQRLTAQRDQAAAQQADSAFGFFSFLQRFVQPAYRLWLRIESAAGRVLKFFGDMGRTVWRFVATALGLDPDIDPLTAIREGLTAAWERVTDALKPVTTAIQNAWTWVTTQSPIAPLIRLFSMLPEAWRALGQLWDRIVSGASDWMVRAAEVLKNTVIPAVQSVLGVASRAIRAFGGAVASFANGVLGVIDDILAWEPGIALLEAVLRVLTVATRPLRAALQLAVDCLVAAVEKIADVVRDLLGWLRTLADIVTGIVLAFVAPPLSFVAFFAGAVWMYLIPECYKAPILDFILAVCIRLIRFLPEPADFMWAALYQGALTFLQTLLAAPAEQKVKAVNLFASIFAGNAEVGAGMAVGLVEGVWESTGGTILFLLQIVWWLVQLPFKLGQWAVSLARGETEDGAGAEPAAEGPEPATAATERGEAEVDPSVPLPGPRDHVDAPVEHEPGVPDEERAPDHAGPTPAEPVEQPAPAEAEPAEPAEADAALEEDEAVEEEGDEEEAEEAEAPAEAQAEDAAPAEARDDPAAPAPDATATGAIADVAATGAQDAASEQLDGARAPTADAAPAEAAAAGPAVHEEAAPASPDLSAVGDFFQRMATEGITRDDVVRLIDEVKAQLRGVVRDLARQAATALLGALNADGAGFAIGRTIGKIVGMVVVEVVLAIFTGGGSTAITAAKAAINGGRVVARLSSVLAKLKSAVQPLLNMVSKLKKAAGGMLQRVTKWVDDVMNWMKRLIGRTRGRPRGPARPPVRPTAPHPTPPTPAAPARPHAGGTRPPRSSGPRRPPGERPPGRPPRPQRPPRPGTSGRRPGGRRPGGQRSGPRRPGQHGRRPGKGGRGPGGRRDRRRRRKKQKKQQKKGGIRRRVAMAARAAWRLIRAEALTRVHPKNNLLRSATSAARGAAPGVTLRLSARHHGTHMWGLVVAGRRGRKRATVRKGHAWLARNRSHAVFLSAARNQAPVHRLAVQDVHRRIQEQANREGRSEHSPQLVASRLQGDVRRIESSLNPRLLGGVQFDVEERSPIVRSGRGQIVYKYRIEPNMSTVLNPITVPVDPEVLLRRFLSNLAVPIRNEETRQVGLLSGTGVPGRLAYGYTQKFLHLTAGRVFNAHTDYGTYLRAPQISQGSLSTYDLNGGPLNTAVRLLRRFRRLPTGKTQSDPIRARWFKSMADYGTLRIAPDPQRWPSTYGAPLPPPQSLSPVTGGFVAIPPVSTGSRTRFVGLTAGVAGARTVRFGVSLSNFVGPSAVIERVLSSNLRIQSSHMQRILSAYKVMSVKQPVEIDHVKDLGWNGDDSFTNLWPVTKSVNRAFSQSYDQRVLYDSGGNIEQNTTKNLINHWFRII